ncbi:DNA helicase-2/ATP-dependent DNA helicase PcrA [Actinomadura luteofluorescens]|uniref:DNA 3'-5' helicase n=1 Tax=Actinomadura luteofluorescens TaxID=46163 RepID=A0A7Y9EF19_9ACTN|nr:ATP-dependent DNA helicase [Actinomadura luteofluorescens]NYD46422.1 DNA helicase-2/ATP-dependent DNA helicase PcrA [Actinomadura luteofluorescens]
MITPGELARLLEIPAPTEEQTRVIEAPMAPMAVIAGAGSGKSETMAARVVWLVANGFVRPERVLGLTFTRKAAAELGARVRKRLDRLREVLPGDELERLGGEALFDGEPMVSTYHSYAARLFGDHALREALEPTMRLISPAVAWQICSRVVDAYHGPMDRIEWQPDTVTKAVMELSGDLSEHLRTAEDVRKVGAWLDERLAVVKKPLKAQRDILAKHAVREQLMPLIEAYGRAKADREVIDHGDQMALAARIAYRHPEVGMIERSRFSVVLLDEYQDTSQAQLVLLKSLFAGGHPVTAVGDPCQSIYGWRGASAGNLLRFAYDFPSQPAAAPGGRPVAAPVVQLSRSFRNGEQILEAAARVQEELRAETQAVPRLVPGAGREGRGRVECALFPTVEDEADRIAARIAGLMASDPGTAPDGGPQTEPLRYSDVAVLARKRSQFPLIRRALEARGIPVEVVGLGGLLTVPEVQDVVATLRVMHDPTAGASLARLLTGPRWRLGPRDLVALGRRARALAQESARDITRPDPAAAPQEGPGSEPGGGLAPASGSGSAGVPTAEPAPASAPATASATAPAPASGGEPGEGSDPASGSVPTAASEPASEPASGVAPGEGEAGDDPLRQLVSELNQETGSLVDALDDLGAPDAFSPEGYGRLRRLRDELRVLRGQVGLPLPDLVNEAERALGLDIEVAARSGLDPVTARADLDAFIDAAATFAGDAEDPTLGAFLAYLKAAETEEFGLEAGRVGETDSVKLLTVHASKGLEWPVVVVPGLAFTPQKNGSPAKGSIFPSPPQNATRWTANPRVLPFMLRGDRADLPALTGLEKDDLSAFDQACSERDLREERRLAYVAVTRASSLLITTGYWWGSSGRPLGPSPFLEEVRAVCLAGAGSVAAWADPPEEGAANPLLADPEEAQWPAAPGERGRSDVSARARYEAVVEGARMVEDEMAGRTRHWAGNSGLSDADRGRMTAWARDVELLLAERDRGRGGDGLLVELPAHLSVSSLVSLARDPAALARQIRRPMPRPPAPYARRGTAFHAWLEGRWGQQRLLDPDELPGAADEGAADDAHLATLRERFERSEWAAREPLDVEVPFETIIGDRLVRGRMDAVFRSRDGGYEVVDWKTGSPPRGEEARFAAVQLAAYRLAWAQLAGVAVEQVSAAFHYVSAEVTVRPADLLDAAGLAALLDGVPAA